MVVAPRVRARALGCARSLPHLSWSMRRSLFLLLALATACIRPKVLENPLHPERSLDYDKLTCDAYATQQQAALYPVLTLQNVGYAKAVRDGAFDRCLIALGWIEHQP